MAPEQMNLILDTFNRISRHSTEFADAFYRRLFAEDPSLRLLFPRDLSEQKAKLMMALRVVVESLHRPGNLVPALEKLGRKHAAYGVCEEHYDAVGKALIQTLNDKLGSDFTPDVLRAWVGMYGFVADTMKNAADVAIAVEIAESKRENGLWSYMLAPLRSLELFTSPRCSQ